MRLQRIFLALFIGSTIQLYSAQAQGSLPASERESTYNYTQPVEAFGVEEGVTRRGVDSTGGAAATMRATTSPHSEVVPVQPVPTPLALDAEAATDADTYMDVFNILKEENACSRLFGGPSQAVEAFNAFITRLQKKPLASPLIGVRMAGDFTHYHNRRTGARYRLFNEATLNTDGPFFQTRAEGTQAASLIGSFHAYTRQARALMLLHELGHLVYDREGRLVLPNDGDSPALSLLNTRTVEYQCIDELLALGRGLDAEVFGETRAGVKRKR